MLNLSFDFHIHEYFWSFLLKMNWILVLLVWEIPPCTADHKVLFHWHYWGFLKAFIVFVIFNCNRFFFDISARKYGLFFLTKRYWVIGFLKCFFWNIGGILHHLVKLLMQQICYVEVTCETCRYNMSPEFSLPLPKQRFS